MYVIEDVYSSAGGLEAENIGARQFAVPDAEARRTAG
jgi:hypothetical protein